MKNDTKGSVIDLTYLKQVSNGDEHFINEMIAVYLKETPEAIKSLETHLQNKDWEKFRAVTHKLKPSFSFFGLKTLYTVINSMEQNANEKTHLEEMPEMLATIKSTCGRAISELTEMQLRK